MSKNIFLPNIDAYFANTSLEHMQKVYDDVKEFEQYGSDVEECFCGTDKATSLGKVGNPVADAIVNSKSEFNLPQFV